MLCPLPMDPVIPEILECLGRHASVVVEAPPGAGKTTRLPLRMLEEGWGDEGEIWVLEPRRLAAVMAARRVASELGEPIGHRVGYAIRMESVGGEFTRLRFVTEGILLRRLIADPRLRHVRVVLLDEFHERHLETDVALAMLLALQRGARADLRLGVLSATLDADPIAQHLQSPCIRSEGRDFPVEVGYVDSLDRRRLPDKVLSGLHAVLKGGPDGHVLVFLPGVGEIASVEAKVRPLAEEAGLSLLRLHGTLSREAQDAVVSPSNRPKLILATNVAETSVTIDGVSTVVDSGLFKESGHSPWSGLPTLRAAWVSQASARQRAGRAGRTRPGRCLRLYTQAEFRAMRPYSEPEIRRADLSGTLLLLRGGGARGVGDLPWLEKPPEPAVDAGEDVLRRLGALTAGGEITSLGRAMLRFPAHPRIARILCEAEAADALDTGGLLAAVLEQPERREEDLRPGAGPSRSRGDMDHPSDPLRLADELWSRNVRPAERNHVLRVAQRYAGTPVTRHALGRIEEKEILRILLVGFPDRVARRVKGTRDEVLLCTGGRGILTPGSGVSRAEFLVVIEARESGRAGNAVHITRASAIEPEWLFDLPGASFQEVTDVRWNGDSERVEAVEHFLYGQLVLSERALDPSGCDRAAEVLADQALKAGLKRFFGGPDLDRLLGRLDVLRMAGCEIDAVGERDLESLLRDACRGRSSFRSLEDAGLLRLLVQRLGRDAGRRLGSMAPEEVRLPSGRSLRVVYAPGARPWVEAPLQCFYGMEEGPRIGGGRVPVVLHLLGPNRQPAQITDDLGRFWSGTYALVRKDLRGRYPKHFWPDDPAHAPPVGLKRDAGREPAG